MGVNALGIGDIRLHSALNQSLDAEIPLVLSGNDTLDDVKVTLASPESFAKAGVDRQYFLSRLKFTPLQTPSGNYVIKVTSREPMHEPFLNFLVEVNWPQGRLQREFTALLDPPSMMPEETSVGIAAPEIRRPTSQRSYERYAEVRPVPEAAPRPRRSAAVSAPRPVPLPPPSESQLTGDAYGPVRRDESLWGIAKQVGTGGATQEQMLIALFRANPQAFSGGRINSLKAGSVLRIPSQDFIAQLGPGQARAEFARQQGLRVQGGAESLAPLEDSAPQAQLKLLSPAEAKAKGKGGAVSGAESGGSKAKGELALEVAETVKQETDDLRSQLSQLKQQLGDIQRLLTLKDEQIAGLQAQQRAQPVAPKPAPEAVTPPPVAPKPESAGLEKPPLSQPVPQAPEAATPPVTAVPPQAQTPVPPKPAQPVPVKPQAPKPPIAAKPQVPPPPPKAEGSWLPFDASFFLYIGGALAAVGFGALMIVRRRNAMIAATESILLAAERDSQQRPSMPSAKSMEDSPEPVVATKSSFLSEFTPSDFDALGTETDEVDPVSEADVYLAYGRYKQAEELIRHAIQQHPDRDECKLKLLEIYYATENRSAFENYARELKAQRKDTQPEFWEKVEEMGRELLADSDLFSKPSAQRAKPAEKPSEPTSSLGSLDLSDDLIDDLKRFEIEFLDTSASKSGASEMSSFIDLDMGEEEPSPHIAELGKDKKSADKDKDKNLFASLDFDLDFLKPGTEPAQEEPESVEDLPELENLISFDLDEKPASSPKEPVEAQDRQPEKTIDDILRELTGQIGEDEPEPAKPAASAKAPETPAASTLDFDFGMLELDTQSQGAEDDESLLKALELEQAAEEKEDLYAGLTDMDQYETKLDLAKAYADMEDEDSAREILSEVAAKGNDRQKAEAAELLQKMDRNGSGPGLSLAIRDI